jgi:hypothetical protein
MPVIKKIFFLSLFLFLLSGLFWGVYNLSFKNVPDSASKGSSADKNTPSPEKINEIIASAKEKISAVSDESVISPTLSQNGNTLMYYSKNTGQVMETDFYGNGKKIISAKKNPGLIAAFWSAEKNGTILKTSGSDGLISFFYHNFENDIDIPFKKNVDYIVWQSNANRVFYKYYDIQNLSRTLNVSDPDGKNWKKIADIFTKNISIAQVPNTGVVSFWNKPDSYTPTLFRSVSLTSDNVKILYGGNFGADFLWDNSGDHVLISHTDAKGGSKTQLGVINGSGGEYKNLGIPTFVSKCVWSKDGKTVYYALPGEIPNNSVLPNDYDKKMFYTADTFWKVNIETGEKQRLVETADIKNNYDTTEMFLDPSESLLFFVNKIDEKLYKITL